MGRLANLASAAEEKRLQNEKEASSRSNPNSSSQPQGSQQEPQQGPKQEPKQEPHQEPQQPSQPGNMGDAEILPGEADPMYFKPPANLKDFEQPGPRKKWSDLVDQVIEKGILSTSTAEKTAKRKLHFYNPARERDTPNKPISIKWRAFPKNFEKSRNKWVLADLRENQDEYCEWEVEKNAADELVSVTFTTEVPEYYDFLWSLDDDADRLLNVYNSFDTKGEDVKKEDVAKDGKYKRENSWNTRGKGEGPTHPGSIAHMLRANNTLPELVGLVIDSTILIPDPNSEGEYLTKYSDRLQYLPPVSEQSERRNSDPLIADRINALVADGKRVTVTNPLGPYIETFESEKIRDQHGQKVQNLWRIERGSNGRTVRAKFVVPRQHIGKLQDASGNKIKYGSQIAQYVWVAAQVAVADAAPPPGAAVPPSRILSYIEGRQVKPTPLPAAVINRELRREPFGRYLATTPTPARTLRDLLQGLPDHTWTAFAADEGIGYRTRSPRKDVRVRLVIICTPDHATERPDNGSRMANPESMVQIAFDKPTFAIVAVAPANDPNNIHSEASILQVASFNPDDGWFNFYDRERLGKGVGAGNWMYFGCSKDAFTPDTQGLGPFCGHANGTLIMKESEDPWPHWHTSANPLNLPKTHAMMNDPLFRDPTSGWYFAEADHLSRMVTTAIKTWYTKRRFLDLGPIRDPNKIAKRVHQWIAHVCLTTTTTLTCSNGDRDEFKIPSGFFFNSSALALVIPGIKDMEDDINPCSMAFYKEVRKSLGLSTLDSMEKKGDNFSIVSESEGLAPWKVLVPSLEDVEGIRQIMESSLLPKRILIALLMVDFWNPIFSYRRARLMRYIPSEAIYNQAKANTDDRYDLGTDLVEAIEYAMVSLGLDQQSPEAEFLGLVKLDKLEEEAKSKIEKFIQNVNAKLATEDGVRGYLKLAETKRRLFRPPPKTQRALHPLAEFDLSLPYSTLMKDDETWVINNDASVVQDLNTMHSTWHPRNTQAQFSSSGCPFSASF